MRAENTALFARVHFKLLKIAKRNYLLTRNTLNHLKHCCVCNMEKTILWHGRETNIAQGEATILCLFNY